MTQYRKKPIVVDAIQWDGDLNKVHGFFEKFTRNTFAETGSVIYDIKFLDCSLLIKPLKGIIQVNLTDWIIRGIQGEYYPCKPDIFAATYEQVNP